MFVFLSEQQYEIPEEEAEWVGLSLEEAVEKQRQLEHKVSVFLDNCVNLQSLCIPVASWIYAKKKTKKKTSKHWK